VLVVCLAQVHSVLGWRVLFLKALVGLREVFGRDIRSACPRFFLVDFNG